MMVAPPYLELAYYVGKARIQEQGIRVTEVLLQQGARLQGPVGLVSGDSESIVRVVNLESLKALQQQGLIRRIQVSGAIGLTERTEVIELGDEILVLRTEGGVLSGPMGHIDERAFELGSKAATCFKLVAGSIDAYYGAISVEYSLETPAELKGDPRSLAFRDFFLNHTDLAVSMTMLENASVQKRTWKSLVAGGCSCPCLPTSISIGRGLSRSRPSTDPLGLQSYW